MQKENTLTAPRPHRQSSAYFSPPQAELRAPQPAAGGAPRDPARRRRSSTAVAPARRRQRAPHAPARRRRSLARQHSPPQASSSRPNPPQASSLSPPQAELRMPQPAAGGAPRAPALAIYLGQGGEEATSHLRCSRICSCFTCRARRAASTSAVVTGSTARGFKPSMGDSAKSSGGRSTPGRSDVDRRGGGGGEGGRGGGSCGKGANGGDSERPGGIAPSSRIQGRQWLQLHHAAVPSARRSCRSPVPPRTRGTACGVPSGTSR